MPPYTSSASFKIIYPTASIFSSFYRWAYSKLRLLPLKRERTWILTLLVTWGNSFILSKGMQSSLIKVSMGASVPEVIMMDRGASRAIEPNATAGL